MNTGYFRTPSIAGGVVVFLSEDDLWTVPRTGGVARRLTANLGPVGRAVVSRDASLIAYTGTEEANSEVYAMAADGGPSRRLTYLGANTAVRGWTPDGKILFISDAGRANVGDFHVYALDPDGGVPVRLPVGPATELAYAPEGTGIVLGRHTIDPARWKRYRGGRRGDIWIDPKGDGTFRRLISLEGNLASPMWLGQRIYFLSDHEGVGNLYSCTPTGGDVRRHSDHESYYARWAQTDGTRIVYQLAAELWIYDPRRDVSERIDVDLHSPRTQRNRRFVEAKKFLHGYSIYPDGHAIALTSRGKLYTMPLWERAVRQYGKRDGVRYRLPHWTHDGKTLVCVSDDGGPDAPRGAPSPDAPRGAPSQEALETYSTDDPSKVKRLGRIDIGRAIELVPSPTSEEIVLTNHRNELIWVNLRTARSKLLDHSRYARITEPVWSPDGRYVAYSCPTTQRTRSIKLAEPTTGRTHLLTRPDFYDYRPSFDPEGRYLYFLSARVWDPVYDTLYLSLGFPRSVRPHLVTLRSDQPSPFVPTPKGLGRPPKPGEDRGGNAGPETAAKRPSDGRTRRGAPGTAASGRPRPKRTQIDLEGIPERVVAFPVAEGRYTQVWGIKGKVLFANFPVMGALRDDIFDTDDEPHGKLESYDLDELKHDVLVQGINGFQVSADGSTLVYHAARRLRAIRAGHKPDPKTEKERPGRTSGWIDLGRVRVSVDPGSEWRQMYREAWRFQRDHFWVPDMSGVDWQAIYERYRPLVEKVTTRLEFSDLMWEMNGELGTSHAYEIGGDVKAPPPYPVGQLACDVSLQDGRWVVGHIVRGDSWDPEHNSPLAVPGAQVREGDTILAVNGQPTTPATSPPSLLVNQACVDVELTIGDAGGRNPRTVVVRTLRTQTRARYREWVERNRDLVHRATGERVGYVHIPDMGPHGYSEFHRYYMSEVERDGLIIDVRFNGGGHVSQLIIEKLARERIGYDVTRWGEPDPYPGDSPAGPLVCITNESAGSDGDIFTHVFKLKGLGPVVGRRTWGGVVGITIRHVLVDNGITTQPEYAFWFRDVGWGVENYGTDPTHEVDITPQDHAAGRDPQMDTALRLITEALERYEPLRVDMDTRPKLTLPTLPARVPLGRRAPRKPKSSGPRAR